MRVTYLIIFFYCCINADAQEKAKIIRGPYLQSATSNSIVIRWRTDIADRSIVYYGNEQCDSLLSAGDSAYTKEHIVHLKDLDPSTTYFYSIHGEKKLQGDCENYFRTFPEPGTEGIYRIAALGDCGNNSINQKKLRRQLLKYIDTSYLHAWILLGDNAYYNGTDIEYQKKFFDVYQRSLLKRFPLYPAPGNHDYGQHSRTLLEAMNFNAYFKSFTLPVHGEAGGIPSENAAYYSFDIGNIHFLSLDSYGLGTDGKRLSDTTSLQAEWLKKDLALNKLQWVVVYWHHPPYTMGSHNSDLEHELILIREKFLPLLERYGVDLVLNGHSHNYERSKLMKGHFGYENSFDASVHYMNQSDSIYTKDATNQGTVYVVSGSAGQRESKIQAGYPHNAMPFSYHRKGGVVLLEFNGRRLDVKWLCSDGSIGDQFAIVK